MTEEKQPEGTITLEQWLAPGLSLAYALPGASEDQRRLANLRYGNELAQRRITEIKASAPEISHRRLLFTEARRLHREAQQTARRWIKSPIGKHIDSNYAEQLRQAALAVRHIAMQTE